MKKAKIVKIVFEEGEYGLTQGHKAFEKPNYRNGRYVNPTGCGYAIESRPSHLIAYLDVKGTVYDTRLDIYFRSAWGRLTEKRVTAIRATAPETVLVSTQTSSYGNTYYAIDIADMDAWYQRAKKYK